MKKFTLLFITTVALFLSGSAQTSYVIDYDGYDEANAVQNNQNYQRFIWDLNTTTEPVFGNSRWSIVDFNQLIVSEDEGQTFTQLPSNGDYTIVLDSVYVYYGFDKGGNGSNLISFEVYNFDDVDRNTIDVPSSVTNPVAGATPVYVETKTDTDLVVSPNIQILRYYPNVTFNSGDYFSIFMNNQSDTLDRFTIWAGYKESCNGDELALQSSAPFNTSTYSYFAGQYGVQQLGTFVIPGQPPLTCNRFYIQNKVMVAFVTITVNEFAVEAISPQTGEQTCPGSTFELEAIVAGGSGNYSYSWSPSTGLLDSTVANPTVTVGNNDRTYTLTVTDVDSNEVETSTILVRAYPVNVNAGNDVTISCEDTTNINAFASASGPGITIEGAVKWTGNRSNPLQVSASGQYIATATNSVGCQGKDTVIVTVTGYNDVTFQLPSQICQGENASFTNESDKSNGWGFEWNLRDNSGNVIDGPIFSENYTYTFSNDGNYNLTLTADSAECSYSRTRQFSVQVCNSIEEAVNGEFIEVFPNPSSGNFSLNLRDVNSTDITVRVVDLTGKTVFRQDKIAGNAVFNLDLSDVSEGVYLLQVITEENTLINKLQVTK